MVLFILSATPFCSGVYADVYSICMPEICSSSSIARNSLALSHRMYCTLTLSSSLSRRLIAVITSLVIKLRLLSGLSQLIPVASSTQDRKYPYSPIPGNIHLTRYLPHMSMKSRLPGVSDFSYLYFLIDLIALLFSQISQKKSFGGDIFGIP